MTTLRERVFEALDNALENGYDEGHLTTFEVAASVIDETDMMDVCPELQDCEDAVQAAEKILILVEEWRALKKSGG